MEESGPAVSRRMLAVCAALLAISLVAGMLFLHGSRSPELSADESAGCKQHALRYAVTDDPAEFARQKRYEAAINDPNAAPLPKPGMYARTPAWTPTLHAVSHSFVVVLYRPGISAGAMRELRALDRIATETQAPVLIAPHAQAAPLIAIAMGQELRCSSADAAQARAVRAFGAAVYSSVAH